MNETIRMLNRLAWEACWAWERWDPEWRERERTLDTLNRQLQDRHPNNHALLRQVNALLDTQAGLGERAADHLFLWGLQMGLELGALRILDRE